MLGRQPGEFLDQSLDVLLHVVHPDDLPAAHASLAKVQSDPLGIVTVDLRVLHADGSHRWMRFTAANRQEEPAIAGIVIKYHDVTDEHAATAHLSRLSAAVDQSSEAVLVAGPTGDIEYVNPAFERATGYSADEVVGRNPRLLQSGHHGPAFYASMWSSLSAGKPWVADLTNRRKDGSIYESATVISPIRDDSGAISGYVSVSRDVTAERRNEQHSLEMVRERALIADTIRSIDTRTTPEEMAQAVCHQVASLRGILTSGLFIFEAGGEAAPYGFVSVSDPRPPLMHLSRERTKYLVQQAKRGPWIEVWQGRGRSSVQRSPGGIWRTSHRLCAGQGRQGRDRLPECQRRRGGRAVAERGAAGPGRVCRSRRNADRATGRREDALERGSDSPPAGDRRSTVLGCIPADRRHRGRAHQWATRRWRGSRTSARRTCVFAEATELGMAADLELAVIRKALVDARSSAVRHMAECEPFAERPDRRQ